MKKYIKIFQQNMGAIGTAVETIVRLDVKYMFLLTTSMVLSTCIPFVDIYLVRCLINAVYENGSPRDAILYLILFSAASFMLMAVKAYVMWYRSIHYIRFGHYYDVVNARKILNIDFQKLQDEGTLDMTVRAAKACSAIARIGEHASDIASEFVKILGTLAIMIPFCGKYVLVIMTASVVCYLADRYVQNQKYKFEKTGATAERKVDYFLGNILDVRSAKELRLFDSFHLFRTKYANAEEELYKFQRRSNITALISNCVNVAFTAFEIFLMYRLASGRYINGAMEIGDISLCVGSVTVFAEAMDALFHHFAEVGLLEKRMEDFRNFQNIDMTEYTVQGDKKPETGEDITIEFKCVCYSYPGAPKDTLHGINLKIKKGEKLAIVGENGAGKTTFIKLLLRLYTPTRGCILLNGFDYREYDINDYYNLFSTVFQDYMVFAYTFRENIMFDDAIDEANSERLNKVIEKMELDKIIGRLPSGLDTYITQNYDMSGVSLSGGESQRMAIARAWYKNAPLVVMDEPTSAIDPLSEERLFNRIEEFMEDKTVVLISHRLSSVRLCDRIVFFGNGTITETGTHEELMCNQRDYCRMYEAQAQWYR